MPTNKTPNLILLDTHIWIWLFNGDERLKSSQCLPMIEESAKRSSLQVSIISVWEVGMLEAKGRINFEINCMEWINIAINAPGITLAPLTP